MMPLQLMRNLVEEMAEQAANPARPWMPKVGAWVLFSAILLGAVASATEVLTLESDAVTRKLVLEIERLTSLAMLLTPTQHAEIDEATCFGRGSTASTSIIAEMDRILKRPLQDSTQDLGASQEESLPGVEKKPCNWQCYIDNNPVVKEQVKTANGVQEKAWAMAALLYNACPKPCQQSCTCTVGSNTMPAANAAAAAAATAGAPSASEKQALAGWEQKPRVPMDHTQCHVVKDSIHMIDEVSKELPELRLKLDNKTIQAYKTSCPIVYKLIRHNGTALLMKYVAGKEIGLVPVAPPNLTTHGGVHDPEAAQKAAAKQLEAEKAAKAKLSAQDEEEPSYRDRVESAEDFFLSEASTRVMKRLRESVETNREGLRLGQLYEKTYENTLRSSYELGQSLDDPTHHSNDKITQFGCKVLEDFQSVFRSEVKTDLAQAIDKFPVECPLSWKTINETDATGQGTGRYLIQRFRAGKEDGIIVPLSQPGDGAVFKTQAQMAKEKEANETVIPVDME